MGEEHGAIIPLISSPPHHQQNQPWSVPSPLPSPWPCALPSQPPCPVVVAVELLLRFNPNPCSLLLLPLSTPTGGSARWSAGASTPSATSAASGDSPRSTATRRTATSPASQTLVAGWIRILD